MKKLILVLLLLCQHISGQDDEFRKITVLFHESNPIDYKDYKKTRITSWGMFGGAALCYALAGVLLYEGKKLNRSEKECINEKSNTMDKNDAMEICRNYNGLYSMGGYVMLVPGTVVLGVGITLQISAVKKKNEYKRHYKISYDQSFSHVSIRKDVPVECKCQMKM